MIQSPKYRILKFHYSAVSANDYDGGQHILCAHGQPMDYRTLFFSNIASLIVFTLCLSVLAWRNRQVRGLAWFAGGLVLLLTKLVLQGFEGRIPPAISAMDTRGQ